jgi:hypothetical protein
MTKTKLTFALIVVAAGLAGVSQAQAGAGAYQLGSSAFESRCEANGGDFYPTGSCDLGSMQIECDFVGAETFCEWDGAQNARGVSRVLGVAVAESLSEQSTGGKKKKGGMKDQMLDLDIVWK